MFEFGLRTTSYANRVAQGRLFFVSEITHIRAVYRPVRKAVQCSSVSVAGGLKYAPAVSVSATRK